MELIRGFAEEVTQGRAPWLAAIHDKGKDEANPHCHLVIHDRDPETGKRVIGMSENGSTERLRSLWEDHTNQALTSAGHNARVDRRTLEAQGIDRKPTIHEGPRARGMAGRGVAPNSRIRTRRNGRGAKSRTRSVDSGSVRRPPLMKWLPLDAFNGRQASTINGAPAYAVPLKEALTIDSRDDFGAALKRLHKTGR